MSNEIAKFCFTLLWIFYSPFGTYAEECPVEQILTALDTPQNLTSPGYPGYYTRPSSCRWLIRTDRGDAAVEFEIVQFEIQPSQSCFKDSLQVNDGPSRFSAKIFRWCGRKQVGRRFKTAGNMAMVMFQALNEGENHHGFHLMYWQTHNGNLPNGVRRFSLINYLLGAIFGLVLLVILVVLLVLVVIRNVKYLRQRHLHHIRIYA